MENSEWVNHDPLLIKGGLASTNHANVVADPSVVRYTLILGLAAAHWGCPELDLLEIIQAVQGASFGGLHTTTVSASSWNGWICAKPNGQI